MTLLRCLSFLLGSLTVTLAFLLCCIYFYILTLVFAQQGLSFHWEILIMILSNSKRDAPFRRIAYDYYRADLNGLADERCSTGRYL